MYKQISVLLLLLSAATSSRGQNIDNDTAKYFDDSRHPINKPHSPYLYLDPITLPPAVDDSEAAKKGALEHSTLKVSCFKPAHPNEKEWWLPSSDEDPPKSNVSQKHDKRNYPALIRRKATTWPSSETVFGNILLAGLAAIISVGLVRIGRTYYQLFGAYSRLPRPFFNPGAITVFSAAISALVGICRLPEVWQSVPCDWVRGLSIFFFLLAALFGPVEAEGYTPPAISSDELS